MRIKIKSLTSTAGEPSYCDEWRSFIGTDAGPTADAEDRVEKSRVQGCLYLTAAVVGGYVILSLPYILGRIRQSAGLLFTDNQIHSCTKTRQLCLCRLTV